MLLRSPRRSTAFTLIEVLTVVGIIAILITLVTLGLGHVSKASRQRTTHVTMENLKAMLTEREVAGGLGTINALYPAQGPNAVNPLPAPGDVRKDPYVNLPNAAPNTPIRYNAPAVVLTQQTLQRLQAVPRNKTLAAGLPSSQLMEPLPQGYNSFMAFDPTNRAFVPAPILDAWGNPIIYVPAGGLSGVYKTGDNAQPQAYTITAPDGRGFWASAGPDGVFGYMDLNGNSVYDAGTDKSAGDDNMYSFEQ